jgi:hypothetical protein
MNILQKKFTEVEINSETQAAGRWRVEVVDLNRGSSYFPFGDKFRKNLIVNNGLDIMMGRSSSGGTYDTTNFNYIVPNFFNEARYSTDTNAPANANTTLGTGQSATASSSTALSAACSTSDNTSAGSRTYTRVFDLPVVSGETTIYTCGVFSDSDSLFSRFLLPSALTLLAGQFIRLTYVFTISVAAIVSGIAVSSTSGSFNGTGSIKLVGTFQNIFGDMLDTGLPSYTSTYHRAGGYLPNGSSPTRSNCGWAQLVPSSIAFPSVNSNISFTRVGNTIKDAPDISMGAYSLGSGSQQITYIFTPLNPPVTTDIGGIFFSTSNIAQNAGGFTAPTSNYFGWYWKFDNPQSKNSNYSLAVSLTQSVSRS